MLTALVQNTNLYRVQKDGRSVERDVKEVEKVIGIYLHMEIVKMPALQATVTWIVRSAQCNCEEFGQKISGTHLSKCMRFLRFATQLSGTRHCCQIWYKTSLCHSYPFAHKKCLKNLFVSKFSRCVVKS